MAGQVRWHDFNKLYHLRYPLLALDIVVQKVKRLLVFQTLSLSGEDIFPDTGDRQINDRDALNQPGWPKMAFIEHRFAGDPTNWWIPNHAGIEAMLRSSGLQVIGYPGSVIQPISLRIMDGRSDGISSQGFIY